MSRRLFLLEEIRKALTGNVEIYCIYNPEASLFFKFEDCGDLFIPKKGSKGIMNEHKRVHGEYFDLKNVRIYF